ncbi:S41 family peptidase [Patescibacteria group bacterium]|nr:S41 family peptidase [Patescibacteria group bacterium]
MYSKSYQKWFRVYLVILFVLVSFLAGLFYGRSNSVAQNVEEQQAETNVKHKYTDRVDEVDFDLFWELWDLISKKHINGTVDYQKLYYGAIKGMVDSLEDPYTVFMDPEETKEFRDEVLNGHFDGIGAELTVRDKMLTIVSVLRDTPAENAGVREDDIVLKIDDQDVSKMSLYEAVKNIRGKKGETVTLTIVREGEEEALEIPIVRDTIQVDSVDSRIIETEEGKTVLYIEISTFSETTSEEFSEAVKVNLSKNPDAIILDMRNNTGGLLDEAVTVSGEFFDKGSVVAIEEFSDGRKEEYKTLQSPRLDTIPVYVLVNDNSASAAEIVAGALRDNSGSLLIGKQTFGKGTVQELINTSGDSSLRISVAKWLTPKGIDINKEGLAVDVDIDRTREEYEQELDPQLDKAIELINEHE